MAFSSDNLVALTPGGGTNRNSLWLYKSTDAHTDVDATDYFAGMASPARTSFGMRLYDIVIVVDTDAPTVTVHCVTAIDSDGNATIGAATLA